jgi:3-hydroxybutyryl-CoA dehydrogenase
VWGYSFSGGFDEMNFPTVGVVGGGIMGSGLATDLSSHGYNVIVIEASKDRFKATRELIESDLKLLRFSNAEARDTDEQAFFQRIALEDDYSALKRASFVIENVTENVELKRSVYGELRRACKPGTYFGVNTSCVSITQVGSWMAEPSHVIGMHFMNPVPMKKLVETIRGHHTSDKTVDAACSLVQSLGKVAVVVKDYPGFVTNRVLMLTINEAIFVVQDDVASPSDVDKIFRLGFGHKMGPLATGDLIGLDTILFSLQVLYDSYNDPKFRPAPLLRRMVAAGLIGRKSGEGFFKYRDLS